ncbi:hypothetical protein NMG60_11031026 [Bertholletia excelsa]
MGDNDEAWVIKISEEVERMADMPAEAEHSYWTKCCIYKVPACVIDLNKKAYKPQAVSFGPYHHGEPHLMPMVEHKRGALLHFLKRSKKPLQMYVNSLAEDVQLMILDGYFMLEVLRMATQTLDDYAENNPIFSNHGKAHIIPYIKRDMLMLQNQLPLLVLIQLLAVENDETKFCSPNTRFRPNWSMGKCCHLLDVYRKSLLYGKEPLKKRNHRGRGKKMQGISAGEGGEDEIIRSATALDEAGILFHKSKSRSLKDISCKRGVVRLPPIVVDDTSESMFLNLMAFERFHAGAGNVVTSYIFFMDNIIDSARDVSLLHSRGVIQNAIGSDKTVANLFNSLSKDITLDPESSLDVLHKRSNNYCKKRWNEWRANLIHSYFRSSWAILSVLAAILLFALV